jgi:hypothetical protein
MSLEAVIPCLFATEECTALSVQSIHCWNGTGSVLPPASLDRHKTDTPCCSAVPEASNVENLAGRRSEFSYKLSFGYIGRTGVKRLFPDPRAMDWHRQLQGQRKELVMKAGFHAHSDRTFSRRTIKALIGDCETRCGIQWRASLTT